MNGIIIDNGFYEWGESTKGCRNCDLWGICNIGRYGFAYCEVIHKDDTEGAFKYHGEIKQEVKNNGDVCFIINNK